MISFLRASHTRTHLFVITLLVGPSLSGAATNEAIAAPYNWTGCYVGLTGGLALGNRPWSEADGTFIGTIQGGGLAFGPQGGCNFQSGNFVFGLGAMASYSTFQGELENTEGRFSSRLMGFAWEWARVGITTGTDGSSLVYIKGGPTEVLYRSTALLPGIAGFENNSWFLGWGAGAGFETPIGPDWTLMFEASVYGVGNNALSLTPNNPAVAPYNVVVERNTTYYLSIAVNYKFGSDIRLKRDIVQLDHLDNGLGLYRFRYFGDDETYVGVMAQEVATLVPDAVELGPDGYLRVDYARLGLKFTTLDSWQASNAKQTQLVD